MTVFFLFQRRFPDFSYITQNGRLTDFLDCVIIRFVVFFFNAPFLKRSYDQSLCSPCSTCSDAQPLSPGPLRRPALHERDGRLRRTHLHDPSHQGYLSHFTWRFPEDHRWQEGRNQLLHLANDQGLYEESDSFEPPPNCPGAVLMSHFRMTLSNPILFCARCSTRLMANQAVSVVLLAGGWWAGDQGVLCRPRSGSCYGAHQSGIRVCGLHCECKQVCTVSQQVIVMTAAWDKFLYLF